MRRYAAVLVVVTLALTGAASAHTASLNGKTLNLPAPPGFCAIDPAHEASNGYLEQFKQFVPGFVTFLLDCAQLEKWRQSADVADLPSRLILFVHHTPLDLGATRPDRKASVEQYCNEARTSDGEIRFSSAAQWLTDFRKHVEERVAKEPDGDIGVVMGQVDGACYVAQANVEEKALAGVGMAAATVMQGQGLLVVIADYSGKVDPGQIGQDYALVQSYVPTLIAANP